MTLQRSGGFRLRESASLYLKGHADQPIEWRPWTVAAQDFARQTERLLFVSSGFMSCHWCHVMAREAFSDENVGKLLNQNFVCIKIDREERPDIDQMLLTAAQDLGVRPGWPLNVILKPDGSPVWAGTYFPAVGNSGQPGFAQIIASIVSNGSPDVSLRLGKERKPLELTSNNNKLPSQRDIRQAANVLFQQLDPGLGGRIGSPKFFDVPLYRFLWRIGGRAGRRPWRNAVRLMLRRISSGSVRDHIGGGFFRYATGPGWSKPHFEKMLSDNAQILELLSLAHADEPDQHLGAVAAALVGWLDRDMRVPMGEHGFAYGSAQSSEIEGEEGAFHLWDGAELTFLLGDDAEGFRKAFNLSEVSGLPWLADLSLDATVAGRWDSQIALLLRAQGKRTQPERDTKILADWNFLLVCALVRSAVVFQRPDWLRHAELVFLSLVKTMAVEGRISHAWQAGRVLSGGLLEDQALFLRAAVTLGQATAQEYYVEQARHAAQLALDLFVDANGRCRMTPLDADDLPAPLPARTRDDAMPAGPGLLAEGLADLEGLTHETQWGHAATRIVSAHCSGDRALWTMPGLLAAADALQNRITVTINRAPPEPNGVIGNSIFDHVGLASPELSLTLLRETQPGLPERAIVCVRNRCFPPYDSVDLLLGNIKSMFAKN